MGQDVTEPDEEQEQCWVKTTDGAEVEQVRVDEDQCVKTYPSQTKNDMRTGSVRQIANTSNRS